MEAGALKKKIFKTIDFHLFYRVILRMSVSVVARSNTWGCNRSFAGISGTNHAGGMYIFLL
jgi:hypothetical protein